jgi:hypothetical protein
VSRPIDDGFRFDLEKQGVTRVTVVTLFPDGDTALPSFFISPVREKNFPEQSALPSPPISRPVTPVTRVTPMGKKWENKVYIKR